ncbi:MAG: type II toxin-antitoxin system HicB family antitoxin [Thermomicrobiales bacterium]
MKRYPIELEDSDTTTNMGEPLEITAEIEALARRPYPVLVTYEEESGWVGRVPDLPGVIAAGDSPDEMMAVLRGAKEVYIASMLRHGEAVPDPRTYEAILNPRGGIAAR